MKRIALFFLLLISFPALPIISKAQTSVHNDIGVKKAEQGKLRPCGYIGTSVGMAIGYNRAPNSTLGPDWETAYQVSIDFGFRLGKYFGVAGNLFGLSRWMYGGVSIGPSLSLPLGERFELDLRPMAGMSFGDAFLVRELGQSGPRLVFQGSVMLRYHLGSKLSLYSHVDYLHAMNRSFEGRYLGASYQGISYVTLNAGIAYRFR